MGIGKRRVNFKLRDANFSRQRYWGEPFPIVYDADGVAHALPESELPLTLPDLEDFKPTADGQSPLAKATDWVKYGAFTRETDTDARLCRLQLVFLRYMDATNESDFASPEGIGLLAGC